MKPLCLYVFLLVYVVSAVPINEEKQSRFIEFPDDEGNLHTVDLEAEPDWAAIDDITRNPKRNVYYLYTRKNRNNAQTLIMRDVSSIKNSNFDASHPTIIIAHGWLSKESTAINPTIREAMLKKYDANVIVLDWKRLAHMDYITAANGVPNVGKGLGEFIEFLNSVTNVPYEEMHLIGFSLGAHLVGNAGRYLNGRIGRITGLDPAGPLWKLNKKRLNRNDAIYVEGIHTDGSLAGYGYGASLGDADFFPNGGSSQPGCITNVCDHNRAWDLFAASITYTFTGVQCKSDSQLSWRHCKGSTLEMGNIYPHKRGKGVYRLDTTKKYPFYK